MDFISGMFNELGTIPSLLAIGVVGLIIYSIFFSGKGGGTNGSGTRNGGTGGFGTGGNRPGPGTGSPPPPPPQTGV